VSSCAHQGLESDAVADVAVGFGQNADAFYVSINDAWREGAFPLQSPFCSYSSGELSWKAAMAAPAEVVVSAHAQVAAAVLR